MGCVSKLPKEIHDLGMCTDTYQANIPYEYNSKCWHYQACVLKVHLGVEPRTSCIGRIAWVFSRSLRKTFSHEKRTNTVCLVEGCPCT